MVNLDKPEPGKQAIAGPPAHHSVEDIKAEQAIVKEAEVVGDSEDEVAVAANVAIEEEEVVAVEVEAASQVVR